MENRVKWVDYAKAIGMILVVYGHVSRGLYNAGIEVSVSFYSLCDSIIYSFHMPLFFFISGLFFTKSVSNRGPKELIFSKIDTIFYPYVIWSLLQGAVEYFFSKYTNGEQSFTQILSVLWKPIDQFWFLYALFFIFIISIIMFFILPKVSKYFNIIFLVLSVMLYLIPSILPDYLIFIYVRNYLVFFVFGIIFSKFNFISILSYKLSVIIFGLMFIFCQWFFHGYLMLKYSDIGLPSLVVACVSILFIVSFSANLSNFSISILSQIGTLSMSIYLMHIIIGSGLRIVLQKFWSINSFIIHVVCECFLSVVIPIFFFKIVRRYNLKYIFEAPISGYIKKLYSKMFL